MDEDRDIRPQAQAECGEPVLRPVEVPEAVQPDQHGRGVRGAATEAAAGRNVFFDDDVSALGTVGRVLQEPRCPDGQVVGFRHAGQRRAMPPHLPVFPDAQAHRVAPVE